MVDDLGYLGKGHKWPQAKTLAMVEAIRKINGVASTERRYCISSLPAGTHGGGRAAGTGASRTACTGLWMSPTAEDHARTREGNSAENFSILFPTGHAWSGMAVACLAYRKSAILMGNFGSCWLGCSQFFTHSYWRQLTRVAFHQGIPS